MPNELTSCRRGNRKLPSVFYKCRTLALACLGPFLTFACLNCYFSYRKVSLGNDLAYKARVYRIKIVPDVRDDPMGAHADNAVVESYAGSEYV